MRRNSLYSVARKAISILKERGEEGISFQYLQNELKVPKRRVYDIKLLLEGVGLLNSVKNGRETRLYWKENEDLFLSATSEKKITGTKIAIVSDGTITSVQNIGNEVKIETTGTNIEYEVLE